jgi:lipoprotein NlpD
MPPSTSTPRGRSALARARGRAGVVLLALGVAACASRAPAPIEERAPRPAAPPVAVPAPIPVRPAAEPDWRPPAYTVKRGDTLHAIALDHGLDYRELAAWNNIENPNMILVGQVLRLAPPGASAPATAGVTTMPLRTVPPVPSGDARAAAMPSAPLPSVPATRNTESYKAQPKALKEPYSEQALRDVQRMAAATPPADQASTVAPAVGASPAAPVVVAPPAAPTASSPTAATAVSSPPAAPAAAMPPQSIARADPKSGTAADDDDEKLDWVWPAKGKLVTGFSDTANLKGIDIAGTSGATVVASAAGKVVYAGTGLRGYGKLVIVKHNGTYLSAYAHNRDIVVKEGQAVARGQKIAEMGNTDSEQVKLHFEIRRHGKPVDPIRYLPPA